jgi:hypothetical protein
MSRAGTIEFHLKNCYGEYLNEPADILLEGRSLTDRRVARMVKASGPVKVTDLHGAPNGLYQWQADPPSYLPSGGFANVKARGATRVEQTFAIDPNKVTHVDFPGFAKLHAEERTLLEASGKVFQFQGLTGAALYGALDDVRRAGLMNILTKSRHTVLPNGRSVLSYFGELLEVRGDRFFVTASQELREEVKNSAASGLFRSVNGSLHRPPDGFSLAGSFKTDDAYGNLQVTFHAGADRWLADVDIDDAAGLGHVFQVLRNWLTNRQTHPYDIHQILLVHQSLDSRFRLDVRA